MRLDVIQEITNVINTPIGSEGFSDVVTSKRTIETTILAEDRQTIVLGGLIQDDITDATKKVPLLGDIPGLGFLFRSKSKSRTKSNLLVFLRLSSMLISRRQRVAIAQSSAISICRIDR